MQPPESSAPQNEDAISAPARATIAAPNFSGAPQPIGELISRANFPQCALGEYIDIQGFAGVVVEIIKESIRVRSPEGITQRFNANRLKTLYAPPVHPEPVPMTRNHDQPESNTTRNVVPPKTEGPLRVYIADPDFTAAVRAINDYAGLPDFPKCAYGKHVDIQGYAGVVVEIVKGSLKIQSPSGITRSYNCEVVKKLYGKT